MFVPASQFVLNQITIFPSRMCVCVFFFDTWKTIISKLTSSRQKYSYKPKIKVKNLRDFNRHNYHSLQDSFPLLICWFQFQRVSFNRRRLLRGEHLHLNLPAVFDWNNHGFVMCQNLLWFQFIALTPARNFAGLVWNRIN